MYVQQIEARPRSLDRYAPAEISPRRSGDIELPHPAAVRLQRIAPFPGPQYSCFNMPRASGHCTSPREAGAVRPRMAPLLILGDRGVSTPHETALWPLGEKPWTYATGSPTIRVRKCDAVTVSINRSCGGTTPRKPCVAASVAFMGPARWLGNHLVNQE